MDEILLTQKVSDTNHEVPKFLDSDYNANNLYRVDKMSLEETKENFTDVRVHSNIKVKIHVKLKTKMI